MNAFTRRTAAGLIAAAALTPLAPAVAQSQPMVAPPLPGGATDVIALLETEHRAALSLLDQIIASSDGAERAHLLNRLGDALTIHNANEENIIYPAIRDAAHRADDAAMLYHQQDESKVIIAQLTMMPKERPEFTARARQLRTALAAHIHQEETVDFPAVRSAVGARLAELTAMSAQLRAHWNPTA
jgi:iron-sulfur cluster repair protein YtfE (RIC family)